MKEEDIHVIQIHVCQVGLINNEKEQLLKSLTETVNITWDLKC
jgi:hypothetical protein